MNLKPNCYECKWRQNLVYDCHSKCAHPKIEPGDEFLSILGMGGALKRLNISGNPHGIRMGWFAWPINFDPVWLETCDGFEKIEEKKGGE